MGLVAERERGQGRKAESFSSRPGSLPYRFTRWKIPVLVQDLGHIIFVSAQEVFPDAECDNAF